MTDGAALKGVAGVVSAARASVHAMKHDDVAQRTALRWPQGRKDAQQVARAAARRQHEFESDPWSDEQRGERESHTTTRPFQEIDAH